MIGDYWRRTGKEKHAQRREPLLVHLPVVRSLEELLFAGKAALAIEGLEAGVEVLAECPPDEVAIHHHGVVELLQVGRVLGEDEVRGHFGQALNHNKSSYCWGLAPPLALRF